MSAGDGRHGRRLQTACRLMIAARLAFVWVLVAAATACSTRDAAGEAPAAVAPGVTFIVVRHAEKAGNDLKDPDLSEAGNVRAVALAQRLASEPLSAIYSTDFRRTRQTARPTAEARGLPVSIYDARQPAGEFAARLRAAHAGGTVLVIGHSNTVPEIVGALSGQAVAPMTEAQFDRLYRVSTDADGSPALQLFHY
jgi:broad specificity phosphatase PhoE